MKETFRLGAWQAIALLSLPGLSLAGCKPFTSPPSTQRDRQRDSAIARVSLTISAAASLQNVLSEIEPLFRAAHPDIEIFYNWGGSGALQRQIEQGAPPDLFFPAGTTHMQQLIRKGHVSHQDPAVLGNRLVLIVPKHSQVEGFADLTTVERIAVGEFRAVPAGQYAQATLKQLNLLSKLERQLVFFNSVRGVLAAVESGNAAAGLVYETDALLSKRIKVVAMAPASTHPPIRYPIAVLKGSSQPNAAQQYIAFLSTPTAIETFERFGFRHTDHPSSSTPSKPPLSNNRQTNTPDNNR